MGADAMRIMRRRYSMYMRCGADAVGDSEAYSNTSGKEVTRRDGRDVGIAEEEMYMEDPRKEDGDEVASIASKSRGDEIGI